MGKQCKHFILLGSKITADGDCSHEIKRYFLLGRKAMTKLDSILKSRDVNLLTNVHLVKVLFFPVVMYGCESWPKERWALKNWWVFFVFFFLFVCFLNWCFWAMVLEKTLESSLDCKEIKPILKEIGRTDFEADTPILWPPDGKNGLIGKTLMLGKIWGRRRRGWQVEMVGWHHQLDRHESGVGDGHGGLACCSPWDGKELDATEWLKWLILFPLPVCDKAGVQSVLSHNCNNKIGFVAWVTILELYPSG